MTVYNCRLERGQALSHWICKNGKMEVEKRKRNKEVSVAAEKGGNIKWTGKMGMAFRLGRRHNFSLVIRPPNPGNSANLTIPTDHGVSQRHAICTVCCRPLEQYECGTISPPEKSPDVLKFQGQKVIPNFAVMIEKFYILSQVEVHFAR